ncbi:TPA: hypothetical protein DDW35_13890 [Candidatus Sumerlaeota bacterium]|jgi:predicted hydrocarbon binding protein|nr:hypothetical protein [Candidatus Sumerlaeota bacterium]
MDRRDLLKQACGMGMCACAGALMSPVCNALAAETVSPTPSPIPTSVDEAKRNEWWLKHSQKQTAELWKMLGTKLDEKTQVEILEQLGRNCAKNLNWAKKYKNNPDAFFKYMKEHSGEQIDYDKEKGVITVVTKERDCDCRLVNSKITPSIFCACSQGWQKQTYEDILGKLVDVEVKESVLRGSKRCVFIVTIKS